MQHCSHFGSMCQATWKSLVTLLSASMATGKASVGIWILAEEEWIQHHSAATGLVRKLSKNNNWSHNLRA